MRPMTNSHDVSRTRLAVPIAIASLAMVHLLAGAPDIADVHVLPVQGHIYMLVSPGGNITLQIGDDGVLLVDTSVAEVSDKVLAAIRTLTDKPIRYIVNTHAHPDHAGGNAEFPGNVEVIAHANAAAAGLRVARTVTDKLTLLSGSDQIDLFYFGRATPTAISSWSFLRSVSPISAISFPPNPLPLSTRQPAAASSRSPTRCDASRPRSKV